MVWVGGTSDENESCFQNDKQGLYTIAAGEGGRADACGRDIQTWIPRARGQQD